jgi:hypothetical protein
VKGIKEREFMSEVIATLAGILEDLPDNDDYTAEDVALYMAEALMALRAAGTPEEDIQHDIKQFASEFKTGDLAPLNWSRSEVVYSWLESIKGGRNEERIHTGADHQEAERSGSVAEQRGEGGTGDTETWGKRCNILSLA